MIRTLIDAADLGKLTSFFSIQYLVMFLPAALAAYTLTPNRWKRYMLLLISLGFFVFISRRFVLYLLVTILWAWLMGLWLGHMEDRKKAELKAAEKSQKKEIRQRWQKRSKAVLCLGVVFHIGLLLVLKYSGFFVENVNAFLGLTLPVPKFVLPIGISFFSLQAVSYLVDVSRGAVAADRNICRVALFLSFFPQIVEGPICRYGQTAARLWEAKPITWNNLTLGLQRIGYGLLKKLVIADRLNAFIDAVFTGYADCRGGVIAIAALCYTIQLYMDFSGAMDAVTGTAQIFGIAMPENFRRPFFSQSISEFWTRWHISLGGWFKDYIFYPVSMSRPMQKAVGFTKKKCGAHAATLLAAGTALFCVWFSNGLWHGAAWSYIFFGMYHFVLILTGNIFEPVTKRLNEKLGLRQENPLFRLFRILRTGVLVVIGELFFRAEGLRAGLEMFRIMVTDFRFTDVDAALLSSLGIGTKDFIIVGVTLLIVLTVSILNERGIRIRETLGRQPLVVRWAVWYALIFYILIFGAYGVGYVPVDPMYANF